MLSFAQCSSVVLLYTAISEGFLRKPLQRTSAYDKYPFQRPPASNHLSPGHFIYPEQRQFYITTAAPFVQNGYDLSSTRWILVSLYPGKCLESVFFTVRNTMLVRWIEMCHFNLSTTVFLPFAFTQKLDYNCYGTF